MVPLRNQARTRCNSMDLRDSERIEDVCHCLQRRQNRSKPSSALLAGNHRRRDNLQAVLPADSFNPFLGKQWHTEAERGDRP